MPSVSLMKVKFLIIWAEALHMAHYLIMNEGLCIGASSAMNCVAVVKTVRKYPHLRNIVTVLCDQGTRYLSKFYSQEYLDKHKIPFQPKPHYLNLDFIK